MRKGFWFGFIVAFIAAFLVGLLFKFWNSENINKIISLYSVAVSTMAILFVFMNTNKQIKNQNKESHRPYIDIVNIKKIKHDYKRNHSEKLKFRIKGRIPNFETKNYSSHDDEERSHIIIKIILRNIGYGIANNINIQGIYDTVYNNTIVGYKDGNNFSTLNLSVNETKKHKAYISFRLEERENRIPRDSICFLIFYSDLYMNIYSQYVTINLEYLSHDNNEKDIHLNYTFYSQESSSFYDVLANLNVDYSKELNKYRKRYLHHEENI